MAKAKDGQTIHSDGPTIQSHYDRNKTAATIWINIRGTKRAGDLDGKVATVLDCLVDEGLIPDDRVKFINTILSTFEVSDKAGIDIVILEDL